MNKKVSLFLASALVMSLFTGCTSQTGKPAGDSKAGDTKAAETIKVGLNYELSGGVATYGQGTVNGIELAIEEINKNGGVLGKQIELVKVDNKSESTEVANVATKLVTRDKVVAMLGPATSGNTKAATPIVTQNKVPLISASATADDITVDANGKVREYIFRIAFNDSFQGVVMANYAFDELKVKNVALLIDTTSDYSKGLIKSFKGQFTKLGGKVAAEEAYTAKEKDFKAVLTKIKGTNPDVIYLPGYYEEVGLIAKQARELGLNVPILGADGYDSPKLAEIAGKDALNKVYFTNHYSSKDTAPEVTKFKGIYSAKYSKEPDTFNALGYDLGYFVADAIKRAGAADPIKVKDALALTKDFSGVTGKFSVDANHNPAKSITILEMKNGKQTFVKKQQP